MKADNVSTSITTPAITVSERMRLKPDLFLEVFMPELLTRSMSISIHCDFMCKPLPRRLYARYRSTMAGSTDLDR